MSQHTPVLLLNSLHHKLWWIMCDLWHNDTAISTFVAPLRHRFLYICFSDFWCLWNSKISWVNIYTYFLQFIKSHAKLCRWLDFEPSGWGRWKRFEQITELYRQHARNCVFSEILGKSIDLLGFTLNKGLLRNCKELESWYLGYDLCWLSKVRQVWVLEVIFLSVY